MTTRMLIDARHREETRVAVVKGNRIEEFDFESAEHKQIKGNIYLAKVTRVEPSLQAAFVDYGGNRHGFLAFSEIHPDYYQIPREDREALLREEAEHAAEEAALLAAEEEALEAGEEALDALDAPELPDDGDDEGEGPDQDNGADHDREHDLAADEGDEAGDRGSGGRNRRRRGRGLADPSQANELRRKRMALRRRYKIQEVIKRRQVLLVQVVKEERGNKGAALTTYLSLAGRYCVLMPNTSHGGGISRKISSGADRKRLKSIISELNLPATMGCIVRTAGLERTKTEIKRDFDYLARLWDEIREKTLKAQAPADIHGDSDLIKRAIRDIYNRDIEEVLVEGDEGYRAAREFMKLLMPSHAKKVRHYADPVSLFQRYGVEDQLAAMYSPTVQLKSGGYLVINPTEALVSIDINSGRSTKEHGIEATALKTNLEAAHEIARQLRLRDMAGLVVIDFIDMEHGGNIRKVERAMKDALKNDRARIQVGRISGFGLMEMSRQRLRTGVLEASTKICPHCEGTGLVRTASSSALSALRLLEEEAARGKGTRLVLRASQEATIYVLNNKRTQLAEIEDRYGVTISVQPDGETEGARMSIEVSGPPPANLPSFAPVIEADDGDDVMIDDDLDEDDEEEAPAPRRTGRERGREHGGDRGGDRGGERGRDSDREDGEGRGRRRRRRRGKKRRGGEGEAGLAADAADNGAADLPASADDAAAEPAPATDAPVAAAKPPRGRARKAAQPDAEAAADAAVSEAGTEAGETAPKARRGRTAKAAAPADAPADGGDDAPAAKPRGRRKTADAAPATAAADTAAMAGDAAPDAAPKAPRPRRAAAAKAVANGADDVAATGAPAKPAANGAEASGPKRKGWWQRTFGASPE